MYERSFRFALVNLVIFLVPDGRKNIAIGPDTFRVLTPCFLYPASH